METFEFKKKVIKFIILAPETGFRSEEQVIELREDPLTGRRCRINMLRSVRKKQAAKLKHKPRRIRTKTECPFCAGNIERETPQFHQDIIETGRLKLGNTTVFPNRYSFSEHHAIAVMTREHVVPMDRLDGKDIQDALTISVQCLRLVDEKSSQGLYGWINWNYMPPSGASIIHPHLQVLADKNPSVALEQILQKGLEYYRLNSVNYWLKLIEVEKRAEERFIGEDGHTVWLSSYAPFGNNEVIALQPSISSLGEMKEEHINSLAEGVKRLLLGYSKLGVDSFNMSTYSNRLRESSSNFTVQFKFITRPKFTHYYTNDRGFMEVLQSEPVIERKPEDTADQLKPLFKDL